MQGNAGRKGERSYASQSRMSATAAGAACTYRIRRLTGSRAIDAGNHDAEQEECLDLEAKDGIALNQPPNEARGEKAIVEPLVGGEHRGLRRLFGRVAKRLQAQRPGPEKHLQNQKVDMQRSDQRHQCVGNPDHGASP
jgi:hypothetical protein